MYTKGITTDLLSDQISYLNGKGFTKKIIFSKNKRNTRNIKNILSLSFPGYPRREQLVVYKSFFPKYPKIESVKEIFSNESLKQDSKIKISINKFKKKKLYNCGFFFKKNKFEKSFLFSNYISSKDHKILYKDKNTSNPYAIYKFEVFMEKNFENFSTKKDKIYKSLSLKSFFIALLDYLKKSATILCWALKKNSRNLSLFFFFVFFQEKNIFSISLSLWNFVFYQVFFLFFRTLTKKIFANKNILEKKNICTQKRSIISISIYEIGIFFNGALRTLNMLAI